MMEFRAVISKPSFPPTLPKKTLLSRWFKAAAADWEELSEEISQENEFQ